MNKPEQETIIQGDPLIQVEAERPDAGPRALGFGIFFGGIIWAAIALVWWLV